MPEGLLQNVTFKTDTNLKTIRKFAHNNPYETSHIIIHSKLILLPVGETFHTQTKFCRLITGNREDKLFLLKAKCASTLLHL